MFTVEKETGGGIMHFTGERLDDRKIQNALQHRELTVRLYDTVDSTNSEARRYAESQGKTPAIFVAESQSAGRGRMGRSFYSPAGTGLYFSMLYPVSDGIENTVGITCASAVALLRAVHRICGIWTQIKWVNDLVDEKGKKLAGILAESFVCGGKTFVIVGIGVNLYTDAFPEDISGRVASILPRENVRNALCAALADELLNLFDRLSDRSFMEEYRAHSSVLGRQIRYTQNGTSHEGIVESIEDDGALWVRHEDGSREKLASGEITVRVS